MSPQAELGRGSHRDREARRQQQMLPHRFHLGV
jgi:hypothetical protein